MRDYEGEHVGGELNSPMDAMKSVVDGSVGREENDHTEHRMIE